MKGNYGEAAQSGAATLNRNIKTNCPALVDPCSVALV